MKILRSNQMKIKSKAFINLVFKAVGLAMGVAVTVLCIIRGIEPDGAATLLGIGLTCLGISQFTLSNENND